MFGTRFVPLVTRAFSYSIRVTTIPKFEYSLVNKQSTCLLSRTALLPSNLLIKNLTQLLQKLKEQSEQEHDKSVMNISLLNQGTLRMSHIKVCSANN